MDQAPRLDAAAITYGEIVVIKRSGQEASNRFQLTKDCIIGRQVTPPPTQIATVAERAAVGPVPHRSGGEDVEVEVGVCAGTGKRGCSSAGSAGNAPAPMNSHSHHLYTVRRACNWI